MNVVRSSAIHTIVVKLDCVHSTTSSIHCFLPACAWDHLQHNALLEARVSDNVTAFSHPAQYRVICDVTIALESLDILHLKRSVVWL
jgi:hypothetical protein